MTTADGQPAHTAVETISTTQRVAFTLALAAGSRAIYVRDWLLGRIRRPKPLAGVVLTPLTIESGRNRLSALFATPASGAAKGAALICHGIGEVVEQWAPIQQMLAMRGVASLVFDYSGYGHSTGWPAPAQIEQDAIAAHARLRALTRAPVSLLGFSLGTGVVPAILDRVQAHRLVLCAGFTSFRAAAHCVGVPLKLARYVPPAWDSEAALRATTQQVLVVHSTHDRLFPVAMGETLAGWCRPRARLLVMEGLRHNEPFYRPTEAYWAPIAEFLAAGNEESAG
ncbi:MAG TPA: alpha/beta fold hydrolase [Terracidiphilus sp.]|nr:alpha/beta fold hydrolase [Terracidiphilus sp.]